MSTEHATRTTTSGRDAVLLRQIAVVIAVERMVPTLVGGIDFSDRWIFLGLHIDDAMMVLHSGLLHCRRVMSGRAWGLARFTDGSGTCRQHLQQLLARLTEVGSQHGLHAMGGSHHLLLRGVLYRRGEHQPAADMLS